MRKNTRTLSLNVRNDATAHRRIANSKLNFARTFENVHTNWRSSEKNLVIHRNNKNSMPITIK